MTVTIKIDNKIVIHSNVHSLELDKHNLLIWLNSGIHRWYAKKQITSLEVKP